ncbi:MAG TPA: zf-HC2 domain-containing protein [Candidatus Saccharimonadales bacterium]|nr:zf-HC2 domain-containing protein [Candidatus Saccharimonadales bacterium]
MIACKEAAERLWDYLDRHLAERPEAELETHLGLCRHCCGELEFARQVRSKLEGSAAGSLPADARARLEGFVRELGS